MAGVTKEHDLKQRREDARDRGTLVGIGLPLIEDLALLGGDHVRFVEEYASAGQDYGTAVVWTEIKE